MFDLTYFMSFYEFQNSLKTNKRYCFHKYHAECRYFWLRAIMSVVHGLFSQVGSDIIAHDCRKICCVSPGHFDLTPTAVFYFLGKLI